MLGKLLPINPSVLARDTKTTYLFYSMFNNREINLMEFL